MGDLRAVPDPVAPPGLPKVADAVEQTVSALKAPATDAAVVALARVTAQTIDAMPDGQRGMMLGQTAPLLLKLLQELEERSRRRRAKQPSGRQNPVTAIRAAHATADAKRRGRAG